MTASRLKRSISTTLSNLAVYQQPPLGRRVPAGASLNVLPTCQAARREHALQRPGRDAVGDRPRDDPQSRPGVVPNPLFVFDGCFDTS